MKWSVLGVCLGLIAFSAAVAEPLTFREARKALPRANAKPVMQTFPAFVPEADQAKLTTARQSLDDVLTALGAAIPVYGALAISPDEGLFVEWLNGAGNHHSLEAARAAALDHCNKNRKSRSAKCEVLVEVTPKGAKGGAALSLSAPANAALRKEYRKLRSPKAFAISPSTGTFGFAAGDGARALDACQKAGAQPRDCVIVVAD